MHIGFFHSPNFPTDHHQLCFEIAAIVVLHTFGLQTEVRAFLDRSWLVSCSSLPCEITTNAGVTVNTNPEGTVCWGVASGWTMSRRPPTKMNTKNGPSRVLFSFQPVLHDWCNKGRVMCYPVFYAHNRKE